MAAPVAPPFTPIPGFTEEQSRAIHAAATEAASAVAASAPASRPSGIDQVAKWLGVLSPLVAILVYVIGGHVAVDQLKDSVADLKLATTELARVVHNIELNMATRADVEKLDQRLRAVEQREAVRDGR